MALNRRGRGGSNVYTGPRKLGGRSRISTTEFSEQDLARISTNEANTNLTGDAVYTVGKAVAEEGAKRDAKRKETEKKNEDILNGITEQAYQDQEDMELEDLEQDILDDSVSDLFSETGPDYTDPQTVVAQQEAEKPAAKTDLGKTFEDVVDPDYKTGVFKTGLQTDFVKEGPATQLETEAEESGGRTIGMFGQSGVRSVAQDGPSERYDQMQNYTAQQQRAQQAQKSTGFIDRVANFLATPIRTSKSPFERMDPMMEREFEGAGELGVAQGGGIVGGKDYFAEGLNESIKARNYQREVWNNHKKQLEDQFTELVIEPGGPSQLSDDKQRIGNDIYKRWTELQQTKYDRDPEDQIRLEQQLRNESKQFNAFFTNLTKNVSEWAEDSKEASIGNDERTVDILNSIKNGQGKFDLNRDPKTGQWMFQGQTAGKQFFSIPVANIASGQSIFRYNKKIDVYGEALEPMYKELKDKRAQYAIENGLEERMVPDEVLDQHMEARLNMYLDDFSKINSVLADGYGYSYRNQKQLERRQVNLRDFAKNKLKQDMFRLLNPDKAYRKYSKNPMQTAAMQEQKLKMQSDKASKTGGRGKAENAAFQQVGDFFKDKSVWIRENVGVIGEGNVDYDGNRNLTIQTDDGELSYDLNRKEDVIALIRDYGKKAGGQGGVDFDMYVKNFVEGRRSERKSKASNAIDQYNKFLIESN